MENLTFQEQIVEGCQALAVYELGPGIGGHISVRVPGQDAYWTNAFDKCFEEITESDVVLLGFDGRVLEGHREVSPGIDFHSAIYRARPDVNAVVHTHGFWVTAQSAMARAPYLWENVCGVFYDRIVVSPDDSNAEITRTLKDDTVAIVLPWHGAITVGPSLGIAAALHVTLDYTCRLDVTMAPTGAEPMPEEQAREAHRRMEVAGYLEKTWTVMRRKAQRAGADGVFPRAVSV